MSTFPFPVDKFGNFDDFGFTILFLNYLPSGALDGATEVGPSFKWHRTCALGRVAVTGHIACFY